MDKPLIDYDKLFAGLEQHHSLTEEQKQAIKVIGDDEIKRHRGKSLGHILINCFYSVCAFAKNLFSGFKLKDPINSLSDVGTATGDKLDAHIRDDSTAMINARMRHNPLIAHLANEATGQYPVSEAHEIPGAPPSYSFFMQMTDKMEIPANTSSRLGKGLS